MEWTVHRRSEKYIPRGQFIQAVLHETAIYNNIRPSTCHAEMATVTAHYARETRRHHHTAKFSRPTLRIKRQPLSPVNTDSGTTLSRPIGHRVRQQRQR